jgi:antitoxin ParD1/3/4
LLFFATDARLVGTRRNDAMNVSLTPELERYVTTKVESGLYQTASEVVREGLRLLKEKEELHLTKLEGLRREIQVGIDQADRGELSPMDARGTLKRIRAARAKKGS